MLNTYQELRQIKKSINQLSKSNDSNIIDKILNNMDEGFKNNLYDYITLYILNSKYELSNSIEYPGGLFEIFVDYIQYRKLIKYLNVAKKIATNELHKIYKEN